MDESLGSAEALLGFKRGLNVLVLGVSANYFHRFYTALPDENYYYNSDDSKCYYTYVLEEFSKRTHLEYRGLLIFVR